MLRFSLSILLLLFSLLTVFPAPVYFLWYVAILVGEFPWAFMGLVLVVLAWGWGTTSLQIFSTALLAIALLLYSLPIIQAYKASIQLNEALNVFGGHPVGNKQGQPFSAAKMITGIGGVKELPYKVMVYEEPNALTLDYYRADGVSGARPCVVVIHGGSWRNGTSRQLPELNTVIAKAGYNVVSINYRKVPGFKSPAPVKDLRNALVFLRANATSLGIDTNNFVLLGRSAGGQIALMGGYTMQDLGVKGVVSYYGPADMIWGYQNPSNPWVYNSCEVLEDYMGGSYTQKPQEYAAGSPIAFVDKNSVPTLMIYGKNDVLVAYHHSTRLAKKLEQYNVPHYLLTLPWASHGFDAALYGPGGQLATYTVLSFLQRVCP